MTHVPDLKTTFNDVASLYQRFRPHYPPQLFTALIQATGITRRSELLEIGPGTGQATEPLARLGCHIVGIELGENMAQKARHTLRPYPNVRVFRGSFEETEQPTSFFDLIYSATAFHWVAPAYRFKKTARLLKPGGYLAIIHTEHVSDEQGDNFFFASEPLYQKYVHNNAPRSVVTRLPKASSLKAPAFDTTLFELVKFSIFPDAIPYSAAEYAGLLSTYSPIIALPASQRDSFLLAIQRLINEQFGGSAVRNFVFTLSVFRKV